MDNLYNTLVDSVGLLLLLAILLSSRKQKWKSRTHEEKLLLMLMLCCAGVFVADIPGLMLDGRSFPLARALLWFFDMAYWALQAVYCYLWVIFAELWVFGSMERLARRRVAYALPMLLELALILTTPFTGWIFTLDEGNVYTRGSFYLLNMLPYLAYILSAIGLSIAGCIESDDSEQKHRRISLLVFMFLPVLGVVFDALVYGISWVWPMVSLSLLMVYLTSEQRQNLERQLENTRHEAELARLENELLENRMAIMLSQIQPHFLFNTLCSIKALCHIDPKRAETAMADFTEFLKGNMNSLSAKRTIPFERELEHTQYYLALEKMRFQDGLNIVYDIEATLFRLPTLTLQPIVENAVRYGVTKREEGGTVILASRETPTAFIVTVTDDGIGFDAEAVHEDGRSHIGITNVRNRLDKLCGGALEIVSTPGVGTVATITIPKTE